MAEIKKTQKEFYARLMEIVESTNPTDKEELIKFCESRVELLAKKSSSGKKVDETTAKVEEFMRGYMEENPNAIFTCSQLGAKATKALGFVIETVTPQRVSAIMRRLIAEGFAKEIKKSQFTKA